MDYETIAQVIGIKNEINVIDNFLPTDEFLALQEFMEGDQVAWYRNNGVNDFNDGNRQFTHTFYENPNRYSVSFDKVVPVIAKLNPVVLFRVKANLLPKTHEIQEFGFHVDYHQPCVTSILYINTNNGYTLFETGEKIESVENRFVVFPSFVRHAGTTCTDTHDRIVININFIPRIDFW